MIYIENFLEKRITYYKNRLTLSIKLSTLKNKYGVISSLKNNLDWLHP